MSLYRLTNVQPDKTAVFQFQKANTAVCPTAKTATIVMNRAYRIFRNPMYLGMLFMLTGIAFFMVAVQTVFCACSVLYYNEQGFHSL